MGILILASMVLTAGLIRLAIVGSCEPRPRSRTPRLSVRPLPAQLA
jgi:hypothetical protein